MAHHWSSLSRAPSLVIPCARGEGMCISLKHGLVVMSVFPSLTNTWIYGGWQLYVYALADGSFVRSIGGDQGSDKGQFGFEHGGLSVTPDGDSVFVAEYWNNRVQEVNILDGSWVRFIGIGVLTGPQYVDCNSETIVVSERFGVCVFSWHGEFVRTIEALGRPCGLSILRDKTQIVVVTGNSRLSVYWLNGDLAWSECVAVQDLNCHDVVEWDGGFLIANHCRKLIKFSCNGAGPPAEVLDGSSRGLATLPDGGLIARNAKYCQVFFGVDLRCAWVALCAAF